MLSLPVELYGAIVDHIDDVGCLKSCSLAASALRYPSQRLLFSSLCVDDKNYVGLCNLLYDSPHIAGFVIFLEIPALSYIMSKSDIDPFQQILEKLTNVLRCFVDGLWFLSPRSSVPQRSQIPDFLLDFFNRQPLRELSLRALTTTSAVVLHLATTIRKLQFTSLGIDDEFDCTEAVNSVEKPVLTTLSLANAGYIGRLLTHPQNLSCLAALRNLSVASDRDCAAELVAATSRTLEFIHFACLSSYPSLGPPEFPQLRQLRFTFDGQIIRQALEERVAEAMIVLSSLASLNTSPALREVHIRQQFSRTGTFDPSPYESLFKLLDEALAIYPTPPRIRCTLFVSGHEEETLFRHFADTARYKMPRAQITNRLVVERYAYATSKAFLI
ncbi:hypothetical protein R3P38DRAFT_2695858 [Favolaschia claudopus]|uniref:F-box domain-containing protein n=1 Tax=Favolaschia claudopus TaxID=2862362 RepID=A0AAW0CJ98_9AGAR